MAVPRLSELVIKYKRRANLSFAQVRQKVDLPSSTIQSWAKEYSKHPWRWQDLVQFADAVALHPLEVDKLLQVDETVMPGWKTYSSEEKTCIC